MSVLKMEAKYKGPLDDVRNSIDEGLQANIPLEARLDWAEPGSMLSKLRQQEGKGSSTCWCP